MACPIAEDANFGPTVIGCRDDFDFTLSFEQNILTALPQSLLLLGCLYSLVSLHGEPIKTSSGKPPWPKMATAALHAALNLAALVVWYNAVGNRIQIAGPTVTLVTSLVVLIATYFHHTRSIRPSTLLITLMLASGLFNSVKLRSFIIGSLPVDLISLTALLIATELAFVVLESRSKRDQLKPKYRSNSVEAFSGPLQRSLFTYLDPLFKQGWQSTLSINNIPRLDAQLSSEQCSNLLSHVWAKADHNGKNALLRVILVYLTKPILYTVVPRLVLIATTFLQPFLINAVITHIQEPLSPTNYGYGLVLLAVIIYGGIAISTAHYQHRLFRMITMFRGGMVPLIFSNTLLLPASEAQEAAAVTLMSTDVDRISYSLEEIMETWARLIEIGIGTWLLARQLGWISFAPLVIIAVCAFGTTQVMRFIGNKQKIWVQAVQTRVTFTSAVLAAMRPIKMVGIQKRIALSIQNFRRSELERMKGFRVFLVMSSMIAMCPVLFGSLITLIAYVAANREDIHDSVSTARVFTALSIITLLITPTNALLNSLPTLVMAKGCIDRIESYLRKVASSGYGISNNQSLDSTSPSTRSDTDISLENLETSEPFITVENASVKEPSAIEAFPKAITFRLKKASISCMLGPSGSGKSALLLALLRELPCSEGHMIVQGTCAYVPQTTWLPGGTVRSIIQGSTDIEKTSDSESWLQKVIWSCALDLFIEGLPSGLETSYSFQAPSLSGGEKQRLNLARAIFARKQILLLDDAFSAMDHSTEALIAERLFGAQGLCRTSAMLVIIAGHSRRHIRYASTVTMLDNQGRLVFHGPKEQMPDTDAAGNPDQDTTTGQTQISSRNKSGLARVAAVAAPPKQSDLADLSRRVGDTQVYRYYLSSVTTWRIITLILAMSTFTVVVKLQQVWLGWFSEGRFSSIGLFIGIFALLAVAALAMLGISMFLFFFAVIPESSLKLHERLLQTVIKAPLSFFVSIDLGITLNRFSQDMTLVDGTLPVATIKTLTASFDCLAETALIALGSSWMSISILPLLVVLYLIQKVYLRTSRQIRFLDLEAKSPLYSQFYQVLTGIIVLRSLNWQAKATKEHFEKLDASQQPAYLLYSVQRWLNLVLDLCVGTMGVIVIWLAIAQTSSTNSVSIGLALNAILSFNSSLQTLITSWTQLETSLGAIARLQTFEKTTVIEQDSPSDVLLRDISSTLQPVIEFRGFSASHTLFNTNTLSSSPILRDINLIIRPGAKIGICGTTGSGKSSLLLSILRFLETAGGSLSLNSHNISSISRSSIRDAFIVVPQDPIILPGTLRLNLDPEALYSDETIKVALKKALVWNILEAKGMNLDSAPTGLSHGQMQLLNIARALLKKEGQSGRDLQGITSNPMATGILLLDEATCHMDTDLESAIQKVITAEFKDFTVIAVAHRLATLADMDEIVVMESGRIKERGSAYDILSKRLQEDFVDSSEDGSG